MYLVSIDSISHSEASSGDGKVANLYVAYGALCAHPIMERNGERVSRRQQTLQKLCSWILEPKMQ
jgi:hypothetical protein